MKVGMTKVLVAPVGVPSSLNCDSLSRVPCFSQGIAPKVQISTHGPCFLGHDWCDCFQRSCFCGASLLFWIIVYYYYHYYYNNYSYYHYYYYYYYY